MIESSCSPGSHAHRSGSTAHGRGTLGLRGLSLCLGTAIITPKMQRLMAIVLFEVLDRNFVCCSSPAWPSAFMVSAGQLASPCPQWSSVEISRPGRVYRLAPVVDALLVPAQHCGRHVIWRLAQLVLYDDPWRRGESTGAGDLSRNLMLDGCRRGCFRCSTVQGLTSRFSTRRRISPRTPPPPPPYRRQVFSFL